MNLKSPLQTWGRRKAHEAQQHNTAPRLEGVVKNKGTKPTRKAKKRARLAQAMFPEWLLKAQATLRSA